MPLPPLSEGACTASRAVRYLAASSSEPTAILDSLDLDLPTAEFVESLASVDLPEHPEAIARFRALQHHLVSLLASAPRLKSSRTGIQGSSSSTKVHSRGQQNRSGASKRGIRLSILEPKVDPKTAHTCGEADASPEETSTDDQLVMCDGTGENDDPVRVELLTRAQLRHINKPVHSMPWHVRGLSDHELTPLLQAAFRIARDRVSGLVVDAKHLMVCCLLLVMLFLSRSLEEAADVVIYGPQTVKPAAEVAIYFAGDPAEDRIRLETVKPEYATLENVTAKDVHHPAGYIWLPLPSLLSLVLRAAITPTGQGLLLDYPRKL